MNVSSYESNNLMFLSVLISATADVFIDHIRKLLLKIVGRRAAPALFQHVFRESDQLLRG